MRTRSICTVILMLLVQGVCSGFDVEAYVRDHNDVHDFAEDVNAAKKGLLDPSLLQLPLEDRCSEGLLKQVFAGEFLRPPVETVRVRARITCLWPLFSETKCRVIEEMIQRETSKSLERYGMNCTDTVDSRIPTLGICITLVTYNINGNSVYTLQAETELHEVLICPATRLKTLGTTFSTSTNSLYDSSADLERNIMFLTDVNVSSFVYTQYSRCSFREAKGQLEKEGKLPLWLNAKSVELEEDSPKKQQ